MRNTFIIIFLAFSLCTCHALNVRGRVHCGNEGIAGVAVSDGVNIVLTDNKGYYQIKTSNPNGYIFISIPSGYETGMNGLIPKFYQHIDNKHLRNVDFSLNKVDQSSCSIFVMTDIHLTGDKVDKDLLEFHRSFLPDICNQIRNTEGPVYSLCLGDMTTDGKWYVNNFSFPEYLYHMSGFPAPIFHVMGNHDNDRKGEGTWKDWAKIGEARFKKEIGPNYYSLNIGSYHILVLDDIITTGPKTDENPADNFIGKYGFTYAIDDEQMGWIKKDLDLVPHDMGIIVAMHVPFYNAVGFDKNGIKVKYTASKAYNPEELMNILSQYRDVQFLTGHHHRNQVFSLDQNITQHIICSASAVSWKINDIGAPMVCDDGTPAGYKIFKLKDNKISWQYKSNYKPIEESQCNVYNLREVPVEYGGDPDTDSFLINVFDWDPTWKIEVYEGDSLLPIEQIYDYDPMYLQIRDETEMLIKRPKAFRGTLTHHLFLFRSSKPDKVKIILTNRFGNQYHSKIGQLAVCEY